MLPGSDYTIKVKAHPRSAFGILMLSVGENGIFLCQRVTKPSVKPADKAHCVLCKAEVWRSVNRTDTLPNICNECWEFLTEEEL